jgi:hypothetical protein
MNSLGRYVRDEMAWRDWTLGDLAANAGLTEDELLPLFEGSTMIDWPSSRVISALARALRVPSRELVLQAADGCGLTVERDSASVELVRATNEELMRELRRRLALGATTGAYLATATGRRLTAVPKVQVG